MISEPIHPIYESEQLKSEPESESRGDVADVLPIFVWTTAVLIRSKKAVVLQTCGEAPLT